LSSPDRVAPDNGPTLRWFALLVLLALVLRIAWPLADPADRFSWSNGIYTDPPTMVHAARNAALFGQWITDYNRDLWIYPLMNGLTYLFYLPFGPGRLPTVVLSALLGTVTVGALAWGLLRCAGPRVALLGAALGAVNQWLVFYSRVPVAENLVAMMLAFACVAVMSRSTRSQALAGALAVGATLFGKYHALGFLPGLLLFVALRERRPKGVLPLLAGGGVVFVVWFAVIFLPHSEEIRGHVERQSTGLHGPLPFLVSLREGVSEVFNALRKSWMFFRIPVVGAIGGFFAIWVGGNGRARRRAVENGSAIYAFWFLGMWAYYSLLPYKAPRYYVILAPALVAGAAVVIGRLLRAEDVRLRTPGAWDEHVPIIVAVYSFFFGAIDAAKHYASLLLDYLTLPPARISSDAFDVIVSAFRNVDTFNQNLAWAGVLGIAAYVVILWNPEILARLGRSTPTIAGSSLRAAGAAMVVASAGFALWQWGWWATHRTTFLEDVKATLPELIGEDAALIGPLAPLLGQDTRLRVLPYFGPPGREGLLAEHGITHVAVCGQGDADGLEARFPGLLTESSVVQIWPVRTLFSSTLEVRRVPGEYGGRHIHDYEPTLFERGSEEALRENWESALDWFTRHREAGGQVTPELLSLESVCWFKLQDYGRARTLLEEAIERRPFDSLNYQNLGILELRDGDRARALALMMKALRLDPKNKDLEAAVRELVR
jgi:tetratricopeptide (TPR) repeat protein